MKIRRFQEKIKTYYIPTPTPPLYICKLAYNFLIDTRNQYRDNKKEKERQFFENSFVIN